MAEVVIVMVVFMECLEVKGYKALDSLLEEQKLEQELDTEFDNDESVRQLLLSRTTSETTSHQKHKSKASFCQSQSAEIVADLAGSVYKEFMPKALKGAKAYVYGSKRMGMVGLEKQQKYNLILFIRFFSSWLNKFGYCQSKVELNKMPGRQAEYFSQIEDDLNETALHN